MRTVCAMAEGTPESELGSCDCFQNYTASEVFVHGLAGVVNQQDVEAMIRAQKQMLQRFEKTNEMLVNCNALSASRVQNATQELRKHTQLLLEMRRDLDLVFRRIRMLRTKMQGQYPRAFAAVAAKTTLEEEEEPRSKEAQEEEEEAEGLPEAVEEAEETEKEEPVVKDGGSSSTDSPTSNAADSSPSSSDTG